MLPLEVAMFRAIPPGVPLPIGTSITERICVTATASRKELANGSPSSLSHVHIQERRGPAVVVVVLPRLPHAAVGRAPQFLLTVLGATTLL